MSELAPFGGVIWCLAVGLVGLVAVKWGDWRAQWRELWPETEREERRWPRGWRPHPGDLRDPPRRMVRDRREF